MTHRPVRRHRVESAAHRGDSSRYRENTLPAIRSAIAAGADFVEVDVRVTADGAVVLLHDLDLQRLWERPIEVTRATLAEIETLGDPDSRPPLLTEVLELFGDTAATLLIDMEDPAPAEPAFRVTGPGRPNVAWCGALGGMRTIRSLDPAARIWLPWDKAAAPTAVDLAELRPERVNVDYLLMTRELVAVVHELGVKVTAWTVDDELAMTWALEIGVDTVTTNQLARLRRVADGPAVNQGRDDQHGSEPATAEPDSADLDEALIVARGLADRIIDVARSTGPGAIATKTDAADLVTELDVAIERYVRDVVGRHFPGHGFVGEEMGGESMPGVPTWYLDPVDGTTNLANRIPWNAFSLALVADGVPVVGVVADPWRGDLFDAVQGRGAKLNGVPLRLGDGQVGGGDPLAGRVVSTELAAHLAWPGMLELLRSLGERFCTLRIMGSGTMTLTGVAAGRGVGAVIGQFGPVDHLAAALIVHEAGGVVLDASGSVNLFPSAGGILAAAPEAADALYALWREASGSTRS